MCARKYQFTTGLSVNNTNIEVVNETKLLGTYFTSDLKWNKNTIEIVKKAYKSMPLLNRAAAFSSNTNDLKKIYLTYIQSVLDQSAVVWHSSLSQKNKRDLERVQKVAIRVILGKNFKSYNEGLKKLNLKRLDIRRENLCLNFAKKCLKNKKLKNMFPKRSKVHNMKLREEEIMKLKKRKTSRYEKSAIPYMTKILNTYKNKQMKVSNHL